MKKLLFTLLAVSFMTVPFISAQIDDDYAEQQQKEILQRIQLPKIPALEINITKLGAKGDSITNCKPAFDKAMQQLAKKGGGKIVVPAGIYLVNGPIHFVSYVELHLEKGAEIKFSTNPSDYLPVVPTSWEGTLCYNYSPLIYGYELTDVAITGEGTIDGEGLTTFGTWKDKQDEAQAKTRKMNHENVPVEQRIFGEGDFLRPQLIQFYKCKNILLDGFRVEESPFWCVHLLMCKSVTCRNMSFYAHAINNDGFDPEYTEDLLIENIKFDNGDDNVAIKAGRDHEGRALGMKSKNIIIRNCAFKGLHAVVIGSEMSAGVENVFVENCTAGGYCKRGIYVKTNPDRGGEIKNIFVKNVALGDVLDLFYITSFYHGEGAGYATDIHDIYVDSLSCKNAYNYVIAVEGFEEKPIHHIYLNHISAESCYVPTNIEHTKDIELDDLNIKTVKSKSKEKTVPSYIGR